MMRSSSVRLALLACVSVASLGLVAGASPAAAKTKTKTKTFSQCTSFAIPIPDFPDHMATPNAPVNSTASASIPVSVPKFKGKPQDGVITALTDVNVRISHTFAGDLVLYLVSPGGRAVNLAYGRGSTGDGYGNGAASCAGGSVLFGDAFPTPIATPGNTGDNPIVGSFKPEQPLGALVGGPARGNWTLIATDIAHQDSGAINGFSLNFTYSYKTQAKKKK
jgi:subtilisin-like proprotein convertase family protein